MFGKQKLKTYLREWLKQSLTVPMERGMSLKDDADGTALYVDSVEEPIEGTILIGLSIVKGDHIRREELTIRILRPRKIWRMPVDPEKPKVAPGSVPLAADLRVIDDETS